ncbi:glycosyltransferase [Planktothrix agardhii 1033]|nr:glycosyltransferase [Planktothrix agardhii 1033]
MIDFTVVIPTYNGASRVLDVLEKLRLQTGTENITWEIIVVDNNSNDQTADVVQNMIISWQEIFPLKYVFEAISVVGKISVLLLSSVPSTMTSLKNKLRIF